MPPHHPPLPSARRTARSPRTPPPRTLQPSTAHTRPGGDSGLGSRGAPGLAWGSPSPLPGGRAAPGASVAHGDPRGSAPAPRAARAECGGFCSRDPSSPFLGKQPKGRADARDARDAQASGWLWVSLRPLPSLATYTKGRRRNAQSLPAEGGARPRRRPRPGQRGDPGEAGSGGREGEARPGRGGGEKRGGPRVPERSRGLRGSQGHGFQTPDPGTLRFRLFPHVLPSPSPIWTPLAFPSPRSRGKD